MYECTLIVTRMIVTMCLHVSRYTKMSKKLKSLDQWTMSSLPSACTEVRRCSETCARKVVLHPSRKAVISLFLVVKLHPFRLFSPCIPQGSCVVSGY